MVSFETQSSVRNLSDPSVQLAEGERSIAVAGDSAIGGSQSTHTSGPSRAEGLDAQESLRLSLAGSNRSVAGIGETTPPSTGRLQKTVQSPEAAISRQGAVPSIHSSYRTQSPSVTISGLQLKVAVADTRDLLQHSGSLYSDNSGNQWFAKGKDLSSLGGLSKEAFVQKIAHTILGAPETQLADNKPQLFSKITGTVNETTFDLSEYEDKVYEQEIEPFNFSQETRSSFLKAVAFKIITGETDFSAKNFVIHNDGERALVSPIDAEESFAKSWSAAELTKLAQNPQALFDGSLSLLDDSGFAETAILKLFGPINPEEFSVALADVNNILYKNFDSIAGIFREVSDNLASIQKYTPGSEQEVSAAKDNLFQLAQQLNNNIDSVYKAGFQ